MCLDAQVVDTSSHVHHGSACILQQSTQEAAEGQHAQEVSRTPPVLLKPPSEIGQEVSEDLPIIVVKQARVPLRVVTALAAAEVAVLLLLPKVISCISILHVWQFSLGFALQAVDGVR